MTDLAPLTPQPPSTSFLARLDGGPLDGLALTVAEACPEIELPAPPPRVRFRGEGVDDPTTVLARYALAPGGTDLHELRYVYVGCRNRD